MDSEHDQEYSPHAAEERWQKYWKEHRTFATRDDGVGGRRYLLDMFAYPSGDLHMGHAEAWAVSDSIGRYWRMRGCDVLHPIGWDSFGLPAENAAILHDEHPAAWTSANIRTQAESFRRYGVAVDWSRRLHTSDPSYYRWTQWLFLRMHERGLAYRRESAVNWCPTDQTVLANEQVIDGRCERCGSAVTRRRFTQWYLKITAYAQRLLDDMAQIEAGWPARVLRMQRHWIGRSEGAYVDFPIVGSQTTVRIFTTRPDTIYGATFIAVAPDSELARLVCSPARQTVLSDYLVEINRMTAIARESGNAAHTGVDLGIFARHPLTGELLPVWAASYVMDVHGAGAVMGVPAHDQRDLDLALRYGLDVRLVIASGAENPRVSGVAATGDGTYVNSGELDGEQDREVAKERVCRRLEARGFGRAGVAYRLHDWLISRQRYWGCPIPIVHCPTCGVIPVPDDQLPVILPDLRGQALAPKGTSPLASATDWADVPCPSCGGAARRDTDTMDTFVDSSWYFFRYCSPNDDTRPFDPEAVRKWFPIAQYVGGAEHATMHLLYARFFTKALYDMGLVDIEEPVTRLLNQGQVLNRGRAMSKSLGNGVDLGSQIDQFGVDAVRLALVFAGPPEADIDWVDVSPTGALRFLQRAFRLASDTAVGTPSSSAERHALVHRRVHRAIRQVTDLMEAQRLNVVVAKLMELVNDLRREIDLGEGEFDSGVREGVEFVAQALSLFAPYLGEEMWRTLGKKGSVAEANWPEPDDEALTEALTTCVVQVDGRVRARLSVSPHIGEDDLHDLALAEPTIQRFLIGRAIERLVVRPPRLVNIVLG